MVGWYGLLAPEIMEVLEASPSKPSSSSPPRMLPSARPVPPAPGAGGLSAAAASPSPDHPAAAAASAPAARCGRGSVRWGSAPAASAAEREGGGSGRRGKEAGAARRPGVGGDCGRRGEGRGTEGWGRGSSRRGGALQAGAGPVGLGHAPTTPSPAGHPAWTPLVVRCWEGIGRAKEGKMVERMEFDQGIAELLSPSGASESALKKVGSYAGVLGDFPVKIMLGTGKVARLRVFLWLTECLTPSSGLDRHLHSHIHTHTHTHPLKRERGYAGW